MSHEAENLRIALISAGAAGMYCGSCMRDNTLVRALVRAGVDARLIPMYTPIRTDEDNVSIDEVFFGGINIYLQQKIPLFRVLPKVFDRLFDRPNLLRWATKNATSTDAKKLGALTLSMLRGSVGHQRKEVRRLCRWLTTEFRPDVIDFSNVLIAGCAPDLKQQLSIPVLVTLQGDDSFLDELSEDYRRRALEEIRRLDRAIDGYIVFSRSYADYMAEYLGVSRQKFHVTTLGIDTSDFAGRFESTKETHAATRVSDVKPRQSSSLPESFREHESDLLIGYFARIAPEKGFHLLVDAFIALHERHRLPRLRLVAAGWMGQHRRAYFDEQLAKLTACGLQDRFRYFGELDRSEKIDFLGQLDLFSVPATFFEPKGIYVLEALACGVPVVQPAHGSFPELLESTGGGLLCEPNSADSLADALATLIVDSSRREELARIGQRNVFEKRTAERMALDTLRLMRQFVGQKPP